MSARPGIVNVAIGDFRYESDPSIEVSDETALFRISLDSV
jgi:hypothetical protein